MKSPTMLMASALLISGTSAAFAENVSVVHGPIVNDPTALILVAEKKKCPEGWITLRDPPRNLKTDCMSPGVNAPGPSGTHK
jgi:hypothetical protein